MTAWAPESDYPEWARDGYTGPAPEDAEQYPEHDCPKQQFLDDPIAAAYGVGSEMVGLIRCPVCDADEEE
jgi:hypothetical protein